MLLDVYPVKSVVLGGITYAWPADPPRTSFYVDDTAITHPIVSPVMV